MAPLRLLLDPISALTDIVREAVDDNVQSVILFSSIARGEATSRSDVDLAVVAPEGWNGRTELEDAVRTRPGNNCDVLVVTPEDLTRRPDGREPVLVDVLADGIALIGPMPRSTSRIA